MDFQILAAVGTLGTVGFGIATGTMMQRLIWTAKQSEDLKLDLHTAYETIRKLNHRITGLEDVNNRFAAREAKRVKQAREAAAKGKAAQMARASARRAAEAEAAQACRQKTMTSLAKAAFRPRDEVVAQVREKRKTKNSGAGVAASKGGWVS